MTKETHFHLATFLQSVPPAKKNELFYSRQVGIKGVPTQWRIWGLSSFLITQIHVPSIAHTQPIWI